MACHLAASLRAQVIVSLAGTAPDWPVHSGAGRELPFPTRKTSLVSYPDVSFWPETDIDQCLDWSDLTAPADKFGLNELLDALAFACLLLLQVL